MKNRILEKILDTPLGKFKKVTFVYGLGILISLVTYLYNVFVSSFIGNVVPTLLILPSVAISSFFGNTKSGTLTLLLSTAGVIFLGNNNYSNSFVIEVLLILFGGCILITLIEKAKREDIVTEHKRTEQALAKMVVGLQEDTAKALEEIKQRDEFLSIASHELKTPLSAMLLKIQMILHNVRNTSLANFSVENLMSQLESAETQSKRMAKMINDLLNVSLITQGKINLDIAEDDLYETVSEVIKGLTEKAQEEGCEMTFKGEKDIKGKFDKLRIEQVVFNLVSNAMKYGDKKPIEVTVSKHGNFGEIKVSDHGIGVPKDKQIKIFERFERAVEGKSFEGLGVGLYITHQIVKAHKGLIKLQSKEGAGSTFVIELPLA